MDPTLFIPGLATLAAALVGAILRYRYRVKKLDLEKYRIEVFSRALGDAALIGNAKLVEAVGAAFSTALHETSPHEPARYTFQKRKARKRVPLTGNRTLSQIVQLVPVQTRNAVTEPWQALPNLLSSRFRLCTVWMNRATTGSSRNQCSCRIPRAAGPQAVRRRSRVAPARIGLGQGQFDLYKPLPIKAAGPTQSAGVVDALLSEGFDPNSWSIRKESVVKRREGRWPGVLHRPRLKGDYTIIIEEMFSSGSAARRTAAAP